jgi:hypothetical protein
MTRRCGTSCEAVKTASRFGKGLIAWWLLAACAACSFSSPERCRRAIAETDRATVAGGSVTRTDPARAEKLLSTARINLGSAERVCSGVGYVDDAVAQLRFNLAAAEIQLYGGGPAAEPKPNVVVAPEAEPVQRPISTPPAPVDDTFDFKGARLRMHIDGFRQTHRRYDGRYGQGAVCSDTAPSVVESLRKQGHGPAPGVVICWISGDPTTIAEVESFPMYHFLDGSLYEISVSFPTLAYGRVKAAMVQKYGEPATTSTSEYKNAMNATFTGEVSSWARDHASAVLAERSGDLTRASLTMIDTDLEAIAKGRVPASQDL